MLKDAMCGVIHGERAIYRDRLERVYSELEAAHEGRETGVKRETI